MQRQSEWRRMVLAGAGGLLLAGVMISGLALAANLLPNGSFENFQSYENKLWRDFPERTGQNWTVAVIEEDGLHFMDSHTFGQFTAQFYAVQYRNYRIEGDYSQVFASRRGFDFVFSQTVAAAPGEDYAFGGKIVSFWKGPDNEWDDTKILKRIGLDPGGGSDYQASTVQWTGWDGTDNTWTSPALAATAQAGQVTVFIQVHNIGDDVGSAYLNSGHLDSFKLELAPKAILNLPAQAAPGPLNVTWGVDIPDPGYWNLWGYDVEYQEQGSGVWQTVQTHEGPDGQNTGYELNGEAGKTYTVRVRPWQQRAPAGDPATTALPGVWQEQEVTIGQAVMGQVTNQAGLGVSGVRVSVEGTLQAVLSDEGGDYILPTGSPGLFNIVADDYQDLVAPPATAVTVPSASQTGSLVITLRPAGAAQAISNNDFEIDLSGWNRSDPAAAASSEADRHTGQRSLLISATVTVSQTNVVSGMTAPVLSFWHKNDAPLTVEFLAEAGGGDPLETLAVTPVQSRTVDSVGEWTFFSLDLRAGRVYTGPLGVNFSYSGGPGANIFIDEVSIAPGLAYDVYLPFILHSD